MPGLKIRNIACDKKVWTTTYWPYADHTGTGRGEPRQNLWADKGCLDKFDRVLKKRKLNPGAKAYEKTPALNFLVSETKTPGYFIPGPEIREDDAEKTTGVDFTGNGRLRRGVKRDFLDAFGGFGSDGKKTGTMDVGWWGSCDAVAMAGMLFERPKRSVIMNGVKFTPQDIKGLLVLVASSQAGREEFVGFRYNGHPDEVVLKDGTTVEGTIKNMKLADFRSGDFTHADGFVVRERVRKSIELESPGGTIKSYKASEVEEVARENKRSLAASLFHKTTKSWLRQNRPFSMDHDPGRHVWNDNYDRAKIRKTSKKPAWVKLDKLNGHKGGYSGGVISFYNTKLFKGANQEKSYGYWLEKKDGKVVNSGWLNSHGYDENPDFMWRAEPKSSNFSGDNSRNPFVLPKLVEEIYKKSIA